MFSDIVSLLKSLTRRERLVFFGSVLIFFVALIFTLIAVFYRNTVLEPAQGGEYREGLVGQPVVINPILAGNNDVDRDLSEILFSDLITLADRFATSTDGKTFTITLKPDLRWSDEEPLTSDDVIFTLEMIQNLDTNSPLLTNWQGVIAERLSEREIRFTIRTPYAFFIDNLRMLRPIPKHIFESVPPANLRLSTYNLEPIGSGPYQFSRYEKQKTGFLSSYVLELNHNFAGTKPHIQTIRLVFYQTYKDALTAFNTKEIDGLGGLDPAQLPDLRVVHQIFELNIPRYYAIFFNQTVQPLLKELAVRQALELATDKEEIIKAVFDNHALIVNGPLLPYIEGYDAARYASDTLSLDLASSTLNKAGWKIGDDGIRTKTVNKTVQRLSFEIVVPQIPFLVNTANLLKAQWEKIGVELTPIVLTPQDVASNAIKTRSYQMLLFGNILRGNPDIFSFWHSSQRFSPGLNLSLYENKSVDALLESLRKDSKKESRQQSLAKIQKSIAEDRPAIFLYSPTYLYAGPKDLGGFGAPFITSPAERLRNIESWYLETTRVFK